MRIVRVAGPVAALAIGLATFGCDIKPSADSDAGSPEAGAGTIGDQCTRIYEVLCAKGINTCGQTGFTLDQCITSNKSACCVDKCDKPAISPDDAVTACANAIAQESCNDIVNNATPSACVGVPQLSK